MTMPPASAPPPFFEGRTPLGRRVQQRRQDLLAVLAAAQVANARIFGSVARAEDGPGSDLDLLVDLTEPISLFTLARLERDLAVIVGVPVDVVPTTGLRESIVQRVRSEAVPL